MLLYLGEVCTLRRVEYVDGGPYRWWQVHIRDDTHPSGGVELTAHFETEPSGHPDTHVALYGLDVDWGMETVREILDEGVDYRRLAAPGGEPAAVDATGGTPTAA